MDEPKGCPFCGHGYQESIADHDKNCYLRIMFMYYTQGVKPEQKVANESWNTRAERTCRKVLGRMSYQGRKMKCSECGYGLGDDRWFYCPKCDSKIEKDENVVSM